VRSPQKSEARPAGNAAHVLLLACRILDLVLVELLLIALAG